MSLNPLIPIAGAALGTLALTAAGKLADGLSFAEILHLNKSEKTEDDKPTDGLDGRFMESLGRPEAQEVFVHPVTIRDRTVNLLYADNGSDAFGDTSIAGLAALCDCLSRAYERLITEQKKHGPGAFAPS